MGLAQIASGGIDHEISYLRAEYAKQKEPKKYFSPKNDDDYISRIMRGQIHGNASQPYLGGKSQLGGYNSAGIQALGGYNASGSQTQIGYGSGISNPPQLISPQYSGNTKTNYQAQPLEYRL